MFPAQWIPGRRRCAVCGKPSRVAFDFRGGDDDETTSIMVGRRDDIAVVRRAGRGPDGRGDLSGFPLHSECGRVGEKVIPLVREMEHEMDLVNEEDEEFLALAREAS